MSGGSIKNALGDHRVVAVALVGLVAICAVLLGVANLSTPWTVFLQVSSAVAGAALGNTLRLDLSQNVVRNQARPATRHLFDQVGRLSNLVQRAENYQAVMERAFAEEVAIDYMRASDWFGSLGTGLRDEITATATAIENWGDLAPDATNLEFSNYETREQRLPLGEKGKVN